MNDADLEVVLKVLGEDHKCLHHAGPNTGPCRTCKRRARLLVPLLTQARRQELLDAAEEMSEGSGNTTSVWDGVLVNYRIYEDSPNDRTPQTWLRKRAAEMEKS